METDIGAGGEGKARKEAEGAWKSVWEVGKEVGRRMRKLEKVGSWERRLEEVWKEFGKWMKKVGEGWKRLRGMRRLQGGWRK